MSFIGRKREKKSILRCLNTNHNENILIYGRKRIGKSELIKECLRQTNIPSIYYECKNQSELNNIESLCEIMSEIFQMPKISFKNMEELLRYLFNKAMDSPLILVLDEYTYLREKSEGLDSVIQVLIDTYHQNSKLKLILCGSYIDIMKSIIYPHNPLFGRISLTIDLKEMDYYDACKFYPNFSNEDKIRLYSVLGGIPYYNSMVDDTLSVKENIIYLIASTNARLESEVPMYIQSEISKISNANEVFNVLSLGVCKYSDILAKSHVSSSPALADVLEKLIKMRLIYKEAPINDETNKKKMKYHISDHLSLYYYRYIFRYSSQMHILLPDFFYQRYIDKDFETQYVPMIFEEVCKQFLIRKNLTGKIDPPFLKIGKYYYDDPINKTNGEFDIVTEDDCGFIFYESKYRNEPITDAMIHTEIEQVKNTQLNAYQYGFISKIGFSTNRNDCIFYTLDDLFDPDLDY